MRRRAQCGGAREASLQGPGAAARPATARRGVRGAPAAPRRSSVAAIAARVHELHRPLFSASPPRPPETAHGAPIDRRVARQLRYPRPRAARPPRPHPHARRARGRLSRRPVDRLAHARRAPRRPPDAGSTRPPTQTRARISTQTGGVKAGGRDEPRVTTGAAPRATSAAPTLHREQRRWNQKTRPTQTRRRASTLAARHLVGERGARRRHRGAAAAARRTA